MDTEEILLAARCIVKKSTGDHYTDSECDAAIRVLSVLSIFACAAHLPILTYWSGNQLAELRNVADARRKSGESSQ